MGTIEVEVKAIYNYTQNPASEANVTINGMQCTEIQPGTYACELASWSPIQGLYIQLEPPNFTHVIKEILLIHTLNITLYILLGTLGFMILVILIKRSHSKSI